MPRGHCRFAGPSGASGLPSAFRSRNFAMELCCSICWYSLLEVSFGKDPCAKHERRMPLRRCPVLGFRRACGDLHLPLPRLSKADRIGVRGGRGGAEGSFFSPGQASNVQSYRGQWPQAGPQILPALRITGLCRSRRVSWDGSDHGRDTGRYHLANANNGLVL